MSKEWSRASKRNATKDLSTLVNRSATGKKKKESGDAPMSDLCSYAFRTNIYIYISIFVLEVMEIVRKHSTDSTEKIYRIV